MRNKVLNNLVDALKRIYPDANYIESDFPEIVDDSIELTETLHLQVVSNNEFGIYEELPDGTFKVKYVKRKDLFNELLAKDEQS